MEGIDIPKEEMSSGSRLQSDEESDEMELSSCSSANNESSDESDAVDSDEDNEMSTAAEETEGGASGVEANFAPSESEMCPVCLNNFIGQDLGIPESCSHTFCLECILEWSKNVNTCPFDRTEFKKILVKLSAEGPVLRTIKVKLNPKAPENDLPEDTTACEVCGRGDREDRLLLCDSCDLGYHCECLTPQLEHIPIEEWFCPPCTSVIGNKSSAASASRPRRIIARTIVSETVRSRIQNLRTAASGSGIATESTTKVTARRVYKRRKTRRRKTTTKKKVTLARTKKTASSLGKSKSTCKKITATKTKRRRKYRRRRKYKRSTRGRKFTKRSWLASKPLISPSVKQRIADRLGLCKPPAGHSMPYAKKSNTGPPVTDSVPVHQLFGRKDELMDFEEDFMDNGLRESSHSRSHCISTPKILATEVPQCSLASVNLLDSIMAGQDILHKNSKDVIIGQDGSLKCSQLMKPSLLKQCKLTFFTKTEQKVPSSNTGQQENKNCVSNHFSNRQSTVLSHSIVSENTRPYSKIKEEIDDTGRKRKLVKNACKDVFLKEKELFPDSSKTKVKNLYDHSITGGCQNMTVNEYYNKDNLDDTFIFREKTKNKPYKKGSSKNGHNNFDSLNLNVKQEVKSLHCSLLSKNERIGDSDVILKKSSQSFDICRIKSEDSSKVHKVDKIIKVENSAQTADRCKTIDDCSSSYQRASSLHTSPLLLPSEEKDLNVKSFPNALHNKRPVKGSFASLFEREEQSVNSVQSISMHPMNKFSRKSEKIANIDNCIVDISNIGDENGSMGHNMCGNVTHKKTEINPAKHYLLDMEANSDKKINFPPAEVGHIHIKFEKSPNPCLELSLESNFFDNRVDMQEENVYKYESSSPIRHLQCNTQSIDNKLIGQIKSCHVPKKPGHVEILRIDARQKVNNLQLKSKHKNSSGTTMASVAKSNYTCSPNEFDIKKEQLCPNICLSSNTESAITKGDNFSIHPKNLQCDELETKRPHLKLRRAESHGYEQSDRKLNISSDICSTPIFSDFQLQKHNLLSEADIKKEKNIVMPMSQNETVCKIASDISSTPIFSDFQLQKHNLLSEADIKKEKNIVMSMSQNETVCKIASDIPSTSIFSDFQLQKHDLLSEADIKKEKNVVQTMSQNETVCKIASDISSDFQLQKHSFLLETDIKKERNSVQSMSLDDAVCIKLGAGTMMFDPQKYVNCKENLSLASDEKTQNDSSSKLWRTKAIEKTASNLHTSGQGNKMHYKINAVPISAQNYSSSIRMLNKPLRESGKVSNSSSPVGGVSLAHFEKKTSSQHIASKRKVSKNEVNNLDDSRSKKLCLVPSCKRLITKTELPSATHIPGGKSELRDLCSLPGDNCKLKLKVVDKLNSAKTKKALTKMTGVPIKLQSDTCKEFSNRFEYDEINLNAVDKNSEIATDSHKKTISKKTNVPVMSLTIGESKGMNILFDDTCFKNICGEDSNEYVEDRSSTINLDHQNEKFQKQHLTEKIVAEVKKVLKPFYVSKKLSKENYKEIMRRCVPKILTHCNESLQPDKIRNLVLKYVALFTNS